MTWRALWSLKEITAVIAPRLEIGVWADLGKVKLIGLFPQPQLGAFAEYAVMAESQTGLMPTNLNFLQAASLALVSLTSYQAFKKVEGSLLKDDLRVAITSGAGMKLERSFLLLFIEALRLCIVGGTGFVAIQLAKAYGAVEIITACSSSHAAFVRSLGATTVVDYTKSSIWDHVTPDSLDVVYDNYGAPGTADKALDKIRKGGSFIFLPGRGGQLSKKRKHGVRQVNFHVTNSAHYRDLDALKVLVEDYKLKPRIQAVFPLQAARSAMQRLKSGHVAGKVVVNITASNISATDQRLVHY